MDSKPPAPMASCNADPMPRFAGLARAGAIFGMSGEALRKKFERGDLPLQFLLRIGPRTLRVDLDGLVRFLKSRSEEASRKEDKRIAQSA